MQHAQQQERISHGPEEKTSMQGVTQAAANEARPPSVMPAAPVGRRFGAVQIWICFLFFVEGLWGLFVVGWPALSLCILGTVYMAKVARRNTTPGIDRGV